MDDRIEATIQRILQSHCCSQSAQNPSLTHSPKNPSLLRPMSRRLLQPLEEITSVQDHKDRELDQDDLRQQMDNALQSGNDSTMLDFLQIPREDILEAIKSMQRHLEKTTPGSMSATDLDAHNPKDTLEREFIETGIDSLRRMSKSTTTLPSWTITRFVFLRQCLRVVMDLTSGRFEIDCTNRIGVGFSRTFMKELGVAKQWQSRFCVISHRVGCSFGRLRYGRIYPIQILSSCSELVVLAEIHLGFLSVLSRSMATSAII